MRTRCVHARLTVHPDNKLAAQVVVVRARGDGCGCGCQPRRDDASGDDVRRPWLHVHDHSTPRRCRICLLHIHGVRHSPCAARSVGGRPEAASVRAGATPRQNRVSAVTERRGECSARLGAAQLVRAGCRRRQRLERPGLGGGPHVAVSSSEHVTHGVALPRRRRRRRAEVVDDITGRHAHHEVGAKRVEPIARNHVCTRHNVAKYTAGR